MRLKKIFCLLLSLCPWHFAYALDYTSCEGTPEKPCLVQDTQNNTATLKNWRTAKMIQSATQKAKGNTTGLDQLWMSGSGVISVAGFAAIFKNVHEVTHNKVKTIIDVDLRQESHGYLNDNAIVLAAENDWANRGKTRRQVFTDEKTWLLDLNKQKTVSNVLSPAKFKAHQYHGGKTVHIKSVKNEKEIAESVKMQYYRLTVTDHMMPSDEDVDRFVELVRKTKPNNWLHLHCSGGDGRTTTFMVMYDMLKNADKVPLEAIVKREASVTPFYNVLNTESPDAIKVPLYQKRALFIRKFYVFAQAYLNGYIGKWSAWSEKHKDL